MTDSRRVLIVEDDEDLRAMMAGVFGDNGFEVDQAGDGEECIEKLHARPFDVVILDLMLPRLDGWEVMRHLKKFPAPPAVVVCTGQNEYAVYLKATLAGAAAFVEKPFSVLALLETCVDIIRNGRSTFTPRDRRDAPRRPVKVPARVLFEEAGWHAEGEILDLSLRGARMAMDTPLPARVGLRVAFEVPGDAAPLNLESDVRWLVPMARGFYYGLAFLNVAPEAERRISDALQQPA